MVVDVVVDDVVVVATGTVVVEVELVELGSEGIVVTGNVVVEEAAGVVVEENGSVVVVSELPETTIVVGTSEVVVVISATCNASGDATYSFGQVRDFQTN